MPWKTLSASLSIGVTTEGWNLAEPPPAGMDEPRVFVFEVAFASPFAMTPVVNLGLTGFDMDQRDSARIKLKTTDITTAGFKVEISTWHETRVYGVECNWFAIGT